MSSISSINSSILSSLYGTSSSRGSGSAKTSSMVEDLFSQLDTGNKGYIEESDLVSAFSQLSSSSSSSSESASAEDVFAKLDSDSDGKLTEDELSTGLEALAATLDSQLNQMRMSHAMSRSGDGGFTQDELESQLSEIGSSDGTRSSLISSIVDNFETADANSDGKVSNEEAMAYEQSLTASSSTTSSTSAASSGFSLSELEEQLSEIGSTDSTRSDLISSIVDNFETADSNSDGKVSNEEAMAYEQSTSSSASSATSSTESTSDQAILRRIMELMETYASNNATQEAQLYTSA